MSAAEAAYSRWEQEHSAAAQHEGWDIFECCGSLYGRWQICALNGVLDSDDDAWRVVLQGRDAHHQAAREFIQAFNSDEWAGWSQYAHRLELDLNLVSDEVKVQIVAAALVSS